MSGSLLRKITQGLSPYHNPEGLTFGKNKLLEKKEPRAGKRDATHTSRRTGATVPEKLDIRAPADSQAYVEHISNRLANEFKWEIEHVEEVDPALRMQARKGSKPRVAAPGAEQGRRRKSKARLTEQRVETLVSESQATETVHKQVFRGHAPEQDNAVSISYPGTEVVGHGSFGVVFTTRIEETGEKVAIKKVLQDRRFKNRELEIMKMLQHPQVADLKYYFYETDPQGEVYLNLVLEYMPASLYQRLRHFVTQRANMPRIEIKLYMYQLFKCLNYLHTRAGVCHRDIKPQNLLVDPVTFSLKLCDFGSAKQLKPTEPNVSYICSRYYRAPELIFGATNYTVQIDVWSSGCVMAELILGQPMFPGESGIDQLVEIIKILGTPTKQEICAMNPNYMEHKFPQIRPIPLAKVFKREDHTTVQFLSDVLRYDPTARFTALQCLCAEYFDELRTTEDPELINIVQKLHLLEFDKEQELGSLTESQAELVTQKLTSN